MTEVTRATNEYVKAALLRTSRPALTSGGLHAVPDDSLGDKSAGGTGAGRVHGVCPKPPEPPVHEIRALDSRWICSVGRGICRYKT
jgi:hypothetical protein